MRSTLWGCALLLSSACAHRAPAAPAACRGTLPEVVARLNGVDIGADELMAFDTATLLQAEAALSQARSDALEGLIVDRIVAGEAAKEGLSAEAWIESRLADQVGPVTDEEVEAFYQENYARMDGAPLGEVSDGIRGHLASMRAQEVAGELVEGLMSSARVELLLEPYRVPAEAGDAPRLGPAGAPVEIVMFSDFQCPYCSRAAQTVHQIEKKYGDRVTIAFRHFPLDFHESAHRAAEASVCADDQGAFWRYHDLLFADQRAWTDADLRAIAQRSELDLSAFDTCLASERPSAVVDADLAAGAGYGMSGTPGFYVNGIVVGGAQPLNVFSDLIDRELGRR